MHDNRQAGLAVAQAAAEALRIHEGTDAAEDLYMDRQCRHILLQPFGERWEAGLSVLHAALVDGNDTSGALAQV